MKNFLKYSAFILVAFVLGAVVRTTIAGNLAPSASPAGTMYTLDDIYNKITNPSYTVDEGDHDIDAPGGSPSGTMRTLTEIWNAIGSGGANLANMFNGSGQSWDWDGSEYVSITGGSTGSGGIDDCAYDYDTDTCGGPPEDRFSVEWTPCTEDNDYCGTDSEFASMKDEATGLVWSYPCMDEGCSLPNTNDDNYENDTYYTWDNSGDDNDGMTAAQLCQAQGGQWVLPHQKQLMQAYIDGAYGNLEPAGVYREYWSATTLSNDANGAWNVSLSGGYTRDNNKDGNYMVRCVSLAEPT